MMIPLRGNNYPRLSKEMFKNDPDFIVALRVIFYRRKLPNSESQDTSEKELGSDAAFKDTVDMKNSHGSKI